MTLIESVIHCMSVECSNRVTNSREEEILGGILRIKRPRKEEGLAQNSLLLELAAAAPLGNTHRHLLVLCYWFFIVTYFLSTMFLLSC